MTASPREVFGQLVLVRLSEDDRDAASGKLVKACGAAGVVIPFRRISSPESVWELLHGISHMVGASLLLTPDLERGTNSLCRLLASLPTPAAAAQMGSAAVAKLARMTADSLRLLGFNTVFEPVLDLLPLAASVHKLTSSGFSPKPDEVARCGEIFCRALISRKVIPCPRHFPGLGAAEVEARSRWPVVNKTMVQLWQEDLTPYRRLLPGVPMVLISPGIYRAYDFDPCVPAMLSGNIVEGLLRLKLGYDGVAVAGDLDRCAAHMGISQGEAAVRALRAGCDLLLINSERTLEGVIDTLRKNHASGRLTPSRIREALGRVRRMKRRLAAPPGKFLSASWERITRQAERLTAECHRKGLKIA